jgi:hypothetical protein
MLHPLCPDACKASPPLGILGALPRSASKFPHAGCMMHMTTGSLISPERGCRTLLVRCLRNVKSSANGLEHILWRTAEPQSYKHAAQGIFPNGRPLDKICREVKQGAL